jgi:hypothetical protein
VEHAAENAGSVPVLAEERFTGTQSSCEAVRDTFFWPGLLMTIALTSIAVGIVWDISWHETIGRDTFWTPAHSAIYLGGVLGGCVGGWLAIRYTFFAGPTDRDSSVSVYGARAPLGAWVAILGALAMLTSAPFDDWWHNAYGLDVKILSPPHVVLGLGMFGISIGALLLVLARQNRLHEFSAKGSGLYLYAGGVFIVMAGVFILEYIFPNEQHGGLFFKVCALMYPARFVALSGAARVSWAGTRIAAIYIVFQCGMNWILELFPAQPKLAPIFNPVTHMVPLPFPLLLIFPAMAIDLLLRYTSETDGKLRRVGQAILMGGAFVGVLLPVQWFFSWFLLSPPARNWFFMSDRIWGYNIRMGDWERQFWRQDPGNSNYDPLTLKAIIISWIFASVSAGVGLFFARWMRKVRR